jgi:arabinan endo-1,5-alpha-L-arabinosidase
MMKIKEWKVLLWSLLFLNYLVACKEKAEVAVPTTKEPVKDSVLAYTNPVFSPVLADPSVVKAGEYFYAYGTEDDWGYEGGYHLVAVIRSRDLVNWTFIRDAFQAKPTWKQQGGIWAPDVTEVNGKYYMYYSYSTWGDTDPGIGLAISGTAQGPYQDQGKVFLSSEIGVKNSIDPFYIEEDGKKYLFWGSFHGIYAIELSEDGKSVKGDKVKIADSHLEGAYVYKKDSSYFFFGSEGSCCAGANSTYQVRVAKGDSLLGPYYDKQGNDIATGRYGELLLRGNDENTGFAGPGHNAEIITDDEDADWFLYHAIKKSNPLLNNGASRRPLMLDKITWKDGWPVIEGQQPSLTRQKGPVFK